MSWKKSMLGSYPLETTCTAFVCPMVLFGHNHAKVRANEGDSYPSWVIPACGYIGSYALGLFTFLTYGVMLADFNHITMSPQVAQSVANVCGSSCVGMYAGQHRSVLRRKYGIEGDRCGDCLIHTVASPCALCQENHEIEQQTNQQIIGVYEPVFPHEPI